MPRGHRGKRRGPATAGRHMLNDRTNLTSSPHWMRDHNGHAFSLAEEARNTGRSRLWSSADSLRNARVGFVSAGTMSNDFTIKTAEDIERQDETHFAGIGPHQGGDSQVNPPGPDDDHRDQGMTGSMTEAQDAELFFIDSYGTSTVSQPQCVPKSTCSSPLNSDDEIVVFAGRNCARSSNARPNSKPHGQPHELREEEKTKDIVEGFPLTTGGTNNAHPQSEAVASKETPQSRGLGLSTPLERSRIPSSSPRDSILDEALADYAANVETEYLDSAEGSEPPTPGAKEITGSGRPIHNGTAPADVETPVHLPVHTASPKLIPSHHGSVETNVDEYISGESDSGESLDTVDQATRDLQDALNEADQDHELFGSHQLNMSDERLAQRLGKQEELGLQGDELLLLDGDESDYQELDLEVLESEVGRYRERQYRKKQTQAKKATSRFTFSGSLEDDPYAGFDIVDRERSSIQPKPRSTPAGLSDSELEDTLQLAWKNDKLKKKARKQERELLRSQGLLKPGKTDLKAKYVDGMNLDQIKTELIGFLASGRASLALPPMDKGSRKIVHEFANIVNLKSKSNGSGRTRYPCLYRTTRTLDADNPAFAKLESRLGRQYLPRAYKGKGGFNISRKGGNSAAANYRDGDIVGAAAPELGADNRGRTMLEKMGWSMGTALGASNNKGMLQPVTHVVKKSRAGLG